MRKVLAVWCSFLVNVLTQAQDPTLVPELRAALGAETNDTSRAQILVKLCFNLTGARPDTALMYGEQGLALAERIKHNRSIGDAHNNLGWLAMSQGELDKGGLELDKALQIFQRLGDPAYVSVVRSNMGWLAEKKGDRVGALKQFQEALKLSESVHDDGNTAVLMYNIGTTYNKMSEFGRARDLFQRSLELEHTLDRPDKQANCLMGIANTYRSERNSAKALEFYEQAEALFARIGDHYGSGLVAENAGALFDESDPRTALAYYREALAEYRALNSGTDQAYVLLSMGATQLAMAQLDKADSSLSAGATLAAASGEPELVMDYEKRRAELSSALGDSKATLKHYQRYVELKDSLRSTGNETELLRLRTAFETERAEKDNEILRATDREKTERLHRRDIQLYGSIAVGLLMLAAALLLYRNYRQKQRHVLVLGQLNELLQLKVLRTQMNPHFIYNSLNAIHNLLRKGDTVSSSAYLDGFARLLRMVLDHSVKDRVPLEDEIAFLRQYLKMEALRFEDGLRYSVEADPALLNAADDVLIPTLLVQPFVENAVWHGLAPKRGEKEVQVYFSSHNGRLICTVQDNGVGRRAARKHQHPDGSASIGLQLTNERLQLLFYKLEGTNRVTFSDLMNGDVPAGTRVDVVLSEA